MNSFYLTLSIITYNLSFGELLLKHITQEIASLVIKIDLVLNAIANKFLKKRLEIRLIKKLRTRSVEV